ncbi:NAD-dependent dehydratase [Janthinobacterium sp. BJB426]|uniref:SDR family oxidoreductase n=1 Tax=Janthinobacterium sp. BJB426 TaxID=2048010 RepID=UPI000C0F1690|nr:SDR family oxidoreductase [Janthinobacterium sp. BJB426]PHV29527.1 NAD-dependent dehydratase [Janthinobacterium sp. BJB426]
MKKILILGAGGQVAQWVIRALAGSEDIALTLYLRNPGKLPTPVPANSTVLAGDVLDQALLRQTVPGHDLVYANLVGDDMEDQANSIIAAMQASGVERLIFVLSMGIYDEVPGKFGAWNNARLAEHLKPFRRAADAIEASGLAYTIVRPAWMTDEDEVDYELTTRHAPFKGTVVSRKSVADLIARIIDAPALHQHANLGVNKPNTDGDKPYFM